MNRYPPIAEDGMVGDLQTAALVSSEGTVDRWCTPRFDSPSLFASLPDAERGGYCRLAADGTADDDMTVRRLYLSDTAILVTRFMAPGGVGEVADFMPPPESAAATEVLHGPGTDLHVQSTGGAALRADGDDVTAGFTLSAGEAVAFMPTSTNGAAPAPPSPSLGGLVDALEGCLASWLTWLRSCTYRGRRQDTTMGLPNLIDLGFEAEAYVFRRRLRARNEAGGTASGDPLQIMYRVDGDPRLTEETLDHPEGCLGSRRVRAGNAAADQLQLDIGAIRGWKALTGVPDWLADHWDRPGEGIWDAATATSRPADVRHWIEARDAVFRQIVERGRHDKRHAFVRHYDTDVLDASPPLMPRVGFNSPHDPDCLSTLDAMDEEPVSDSLARSGRLAQARYAFDKMLTYANHVGLFAEGIGPSGGQLGNFPQAFTHLALVTAAMALDEKLGEERTARAADDHRHPPAHGLTAPAASGGEENG